MHIVVVGLNHRTAPIEVRERLSISEFALPNALEAFRARPGLFETAILSTCNRTEVYAMVSHAEHERALIQCLAQHRQVPEEEFRGYLYTYHDVEAVRHLFRVASGLDSLVLGEPQILGQVRDAFTHAMEAGCTGPRLNALFRAAIATGKRARTETGIGKGGFSIGHAAVELASSIFGSLQRTTILILGAGKMSELTAKHLIAGGADCVFVANRTFEKAKALAQRLGGSAIEYDRFQETLQQADVVISSTAAPHPIVHVETLLPVLRRRRGRPLFLIDIAVPRDISPAVADLDGVFLYDIDDLEEVVAETARERAGEVSRVEAIVQEEVREFMAWLRSLEAVPVVTQLKHKYEAIRQAELQRLRNQLPDLPEHAWERIEAATRSMMNRASRDPVARIKASVSGEAVDTNSNLLNAARYLFGLSEDNDAQGADAGEEVET